MGARDGASRRVTRLLLAETMSTTYELLYFPLRGRAEALRLMFHAAGVAFTNTGVTNWPELKPKTPLGQLPVLVEKSEAGERQIAQSGAIIRHLARMFGLYGKDEAEMTTTDMVAETVNDWRGKFAPVQFKAFMNTSEDVIAKYWAELPTTLRTISGLLSSSGLFVGDKLTYADVLAFDALDGNLAMNADCLAEFPQLKAFYDKVAAHDGIKAYLAERK